MPEGIFSFDLHVLSLPPTFNLSHDQTLQFFTEGDDSERLLLLPNGAHRVDFFCSMNQLANACKSTRMLRLATRIRR